MAEKQVISPGVFTNEIDQTFLPAAIGNIGAVLIGPTVNGPAGIPTVVNSYSEFQSTFGDTFHSGSKTTGDGTYQQYFTSHTAREYLRHSSPLTVVRVLAGDYSNASATISSSIDPAVVGGGVQATASIRLKYPITGSIGVTPSASFGGVSFVFSGSRNSSTAWAQQTANTATKLYISSSGHVGKTAEVFRNVINNNISLHGLAISASIGSSGSGEVTMSFNLPGAFGEYGSLTGGSTSGSGWSSLNLITTHSAGFTKIRHFAGGHDYNTETFTNVLKLHTHADGEIMNNLSTHGSDNVLEDGTKDNLRWEIATVNQSRGTFSLKIRRGDDNIQRKKTVETWNNVSLDPNAQNYIAKVIGDQKWVLRQSGGSDPYLQLSGSYPNKSKYVRVEVLVDTPNYLDENGNVRLAATSASLPSVASGSNSGSFGGSFSGGSDGTVQNPKNFYQNITDTNSQGLNLNVARSGKTAYEDAINLLGNADEYDINLVLMPGVTGGGSGGDSIINKAIAMCEDRGDCFVVADPTLYDSAITTATGEALSRNSSYAAMYYPWIQVRDADLGTNVWVPPSTVVAGVYTFNDRVAHPWFAPAGLNRGVIDSAVQAERKLTHSNRDTLYESNVNPIATYPGQGVCIWGQKTLQKKASALDRVNVRRLLIKLKKFIASTSRFLVFEQNNTQTRSRFLNIVNPYMEQIQSNSGLSAFRVVMDDSNNTPDLVDRNILYGQIFIQPTRTAEFIILDFTVQPTGATFPE
jgi:hypothetical protein